MTDPTKHFLQIQSKKLRLSADLHRINKIADLTIYPSLIPRELDEIFGSIQIFTSSNDSLLQIPFYSRIFHGSLDFFVNETMFYCSPTTKCEPVRLFNRFDFDLAVTNISIDQIDLVSNYLQIELPSSIVFLKPNVSSELFCVVVKNVSSNFFNMKINVEIFTNLSSFNLNFYLYNGLLTVS